MIYVLLLLIIFLQIYLIKLQLENNLINRANGISSTREERIESIKNIGPIVVRSYTDEELYKLEQKEIVNEL